MTQNLHPVVLIAGNTAAGKTTLAAGVAQNLGFPFVDVGSIVRASALDMVGRGGDLQDTGDVSRYARDLRLGFSTAEGTGLHVQVNETTVDREDPALQQPFLDTETLLFCGELDPRLHRLQREIAGTTPVVFGVRNGDAFGNDEAVKLYIEPGEENRIRRRSLHEFGVPPEELDMATRRVLYDRVVAKEFRNPATIQGDVTERGFRVFRNAGSVEENIGLLTALARSALEEQRVLREGGTYPMERR